MSRGTKLKWVLNFLCSVKSHDQVGNTFDKIKANSKIHLSVITKIGHSPDMVINFQENNTTIRQRMNTGGQVTTYPLQS